MFSKVKLCGRNLLLLLRVSNVYNILIQNFKVWQVCLLCFVFFNVKVTKAIGSTPSDGIFFPFNFFSFFFSLVLSFAIYVCIEFIVENKIYRAFDRSDRPIHVKFISKRISFSRVCTTLTLNNEEKSLCLFEILNVLYRRLNTVRNNRTRTS